MPLSPTPDAAFRERSPLRAGRTTVILPRMELARSRGGVTVYVVEQRGFPLVSVRYVMRTGAGERRVAAARIAMASLVSGVPALAAFRVDSSRSAVWIGADVAPASVARVLEQLGKSLQKAELDHVYAGALRAREQRLRALDVQSGQAKAISHVLALIERSPTKETLSVTEDPAEVIASASSALVVSGDVALADLRPALAAFDAVPSRPAPEPRVEERPSAKLDGRIDVLNAGAFQPIVAVATPAPGVTSPDVPAFTVLVHAVAGGVRVPAIAEGSNRIRGVLRRPPGVVGGAAGVDAVVGGLSVAKSGRGEPSSDCRRRSRRSIPRRASPRPRRAT